MRRDDGGGSGVERGDGVWRAARQERPATLTVIIGILMILLFGITWLAKKYQIMPMDPNALHFQSLLSLLVTAVFGRGWFYYVTMGSVLLALALSANTALRIFRGWCGPLRSMTTCRTCLSCVVGGCCFRMGSMR